MTINNNKNGTNWKSLEPNAKLIVYRCLSPLKTSWKSAYTNGLFMPDESTYWSIVVTCDETVSEREDSKQWNVLVPTNRPYSDTH